jgi:hypothetical protein
MLFLLLAAFPLGLVVRLALAIIVFELVDITIIVFGLLFRFVAAAAAAVVGVDVVVGDRRLTDVLLVLF